MFMLSLFLCLFLGLFFSASPFFTPPAYSGFEWTPPAEDKTNKEKTSNLPLSIEIEPAENAANNDAIAALSQEIYFDMVEGFGYDIPLALALRQVVPADFTVSFGSISPGQQVSWSGGRGWNLILSDIMATAGARAVMNGQAIHLMPYPGQGPRLRIDNVPFSLRQATPGPDFGNKTGATIQHWHAAPSERVTDILRDWARREGADLFWNARTDLVLNQPLRFEGSLEYAANALLSQIQGLHMKAKLYPNLPDGPAILLVREISR